MDAANDLIRDGAQGIGELLGGNPALPLSSQQSDDIPAADARHTAHIDQRLVHGDTSDDRAALVADNEVFETQPEVFVIGIDLFSFQIDAVVLQFQRRLACGSS